jgi:hypothetical protein
MVSHPANAVAIFIGDKLGGHRIAWTLGAACGPFHPWIGKLTDCYLFANSGSPIHEIVEDFYRVQLLFASCISYYVVMVSLLRG